MATVTHATAATGTDSGNGKISKNAWNEDHVVTGLSGGIGEYASKYNPDHETPATTPAIVAEFNGALDSGWSWGTAPTTEDYTTYPGYGYFEHTTGNHWLSKAWTPGASDVTVAAKLLIGRPKTDSTDAPACMLGVADATGTDPSNGVLAAIFVKQSTTTELYNYERNSGSWVGIGSARQMSESYNLVPFYLRVTRTVSGPTWRFYHSLNGIVWTENASTSSKSLTIGAVCMRISDQANIVVVDWIRAWNSIVTKVGA